MAMKVTTYGASAITHRQTCALHDNEGPTVCSGTLKKGGICPHRAAGPQVPRMMPTCKIHRDQLKVSGWCRALLPCGFECGRLCEWKPHEFQLCPGHHEYPMTCYFLKIPTEMRLRVYRFLLPDGPIPARYGNHRSLTADGEGVYTAILRVNHQIHDEAAGLLYGTSVFAIELSGNQLTMCNSTNTFDRYGFSNHANHELQNYQFVRNGVSGHGNHALQDYQMQLMLLELQNKKRLIMARKELDNINGESNSNGRPAIRSIQLPTGPPTTYTYKPIEPIWHPPLSKRYFNMIRSFLIEFVFPSSRQISAIHHTYGSSNTDASNYTVLELKLYDYCDCLHRLIERLRLIQKPISHLEIIIMFGNTYTELNEAFSAVQLLLQPFRRLRNVAKLELLSITMKGFQGHDAELLVTDGIPCATDGTFTDYVKSWSRDLFSSEPSLECSQVFEAYWKLEKLLSSIREHCHPTNPKFYRFADLLHAARIAREAEDITRFKEIWDQVINIWFDYLNSHEGFQSSVARSIDAIYDIVGN
jgi:hypothetical protein